MPYHPGRPFGGEHYPKHELFSDHEASETEEEKIEKKYSDLPKKERLAHIAHDEELLSEHRAKMAEELGSNGQADQYLRNFYHDPRAAEIYKENVHKRREQKVEKVKGFFKKLMFWKK